MLDCIDSRSFPSYYSGFLNSTFVFEALPGKLDIKRLSPSIHYILTHAFKNDHSHLHLEYIRDCHGITMGMACTSSF